MRSQTAGDTEEGGSTFGPWMVAQRNRHRLATGNKGNSINSAGDGARSSEQNQPTVNARNQGAKIMAMPPTQSDQAVKAKGFRRVQ